MNNEAEARQLLDKVVSRATSAVSAIATAFREPWTTNPGAGVKAVFGVWTNGMTRHLVAIVVLARNESLGRIADVHYRQMLEILLQVRYMTSAPPQDRELLAQKISAWGCLEWLSKMEPFKEQPFAKEGWAEMTAQLEKYNPALVLQAKSEQAKRYYWFGKSFSKLAHNVSRKGEDLEGLYHLASTQLHGTWSVTLGVTNPKPGALDFREWPDDATLSWWAADIVDQGTQLCVQTWNEIAGATGAPKIG